MTDQEYGEHGRCQATAKSTGQQCKKAAVGPHGKCDVHGGKSKKGVDHPNFKTGRTSKYFKSKLSERQQEVFEDWVESFTEEDADLDPKDVLALIAGKVMLTGEDTLDPSLVREGRQILKEFGVVETPANKHEIEHSGSVDTEVSVPSHVAEAIATNAEANLEGGGDS